MAAVVLAKSYANPFDSIPLIEGYLGRQKVRGPVRFDLLLANGTTYNRFFIGKFDGAASMGTSKKWTHRVTKASHRILRGCWPRTSTNWICRC
jgi:hypothetical protein